MNPILKPSKKENDNSMFFIIKVLVVIPDFLPFLLYNQITIRNKKDAFPASFLFCFPKNHICNQKKRSTNLALVNLPILSGSIMILSASQPPSFAHAYWHTSSHLPALTVPDSLSLRKSYSHHTKIPAVHSNHHQD